jgi:hypothetical protein
MRHLFLSLVFAPSIALAAPTRSDEPIGEIVTVDVSETTIRQLGYFPDAWRKAVPEGGRCAVAVAVDSSGVPLDAVATDCPPGLASSATVGLLKTRWYPLKRDGERTACAFEIVVNFRTPSAPRATTWQPIERIGAAPAPASAAAVRAPGSAR